MNAEAKFWNKLAPKYAAQPVKNVAAFERKQAITREQLRPDSKVLEIGCGTGSLALAMSPFAGHIHALDVSAEMLRIANEKKQAKGVTNVSFHVGTLENYTPNEPDGFDSAWAYSILHLVPDRRRTLNTIFGLLKPGGSFISSNVCLNETWIPYGTIITLLRIFGKAPVVYCYDRKTILREIQDAGFVDIQERDVGAERTVAFVVTKKPG